MELRRPWPSWLEAAVILGLLALPMVHLFNWAVLEAFWPVRVQVAGLDVYADHPVGARVRGRMRDAVHEVERAGLGSSNGQRVYLTSSPWRFAALTWLPYPSVRGAYIPDSRAIALAPSTMAWPAANADVDTDPHDAMTRVLVHELTHARAHRLIGDAVYASLPWWKTEGLASYVQFREETRAVRPTLHGPEAAYLPGEETADYFWARTLTTAVLAEHQAPDGALQETALPPVDLGRWVRDTRSGTDLTRTHRPMGGEPTLDGHIFLMGAAKAGALPSGTMDLENR